MKKRLTTFAALVAALAAITAVTVAPAATAAPPAASSAVVSGVDPVTGGTFTGTLSNIHVVNQNGVLTLLGTLTGTLTNAAGAVLGSTGPNGLPVSLPLAGAPAAATGSCTILDLTLGPLHLNLLGLVVDLNQVHLTITGQTGNGQLLGNLLCGLANALNGSGGAGGLANILNRLLGGL